MKYSDVFAYQWNNGILLFLSNHISSFNKKEKVVFNFFIVKYKSNKNVLLLLLRFICFVFLYYCTVLYCIVLGAHHANKEVAEFRQNLLIIVALVMDSCVSLVFRNGTDVGLVESLPFQCGAAEGR